MKQHLDQLGDRGLKVDFPHSRMRLKNPFAVK